MACAGYFDELGSRIERAFRAIGHDEEGFPDLAHEALERAPAHRSIRPVDLLHEVAAGGALPGQLVDRSTFGEPPLTVFASSRFVIDVYFWFGATTTTHEHGFCGAFQVLSGSSLHATRRFACTRRVNSRFLLGDVRTDRCEVLHVGDTRRILPGRRFAHALFHLDSPSTTVVVRTRSNPDANPQYQYAPPHVAFDPFYRTRARELQHEALDALAQVDESSYLSALDAALADSTLEEAFFLLDAHTARCMETAGSLEGPELQGRRAVCESRHGKADVDALLRCVKEACRTRDLMESRKQTRDADERFVLAALLNAHDRGQLLEFVRGRYPTESPADAFMRAFSRMTKPAEDGRDNVLGVELGDDALTCIRFLLEGVAPADLARRLLEARAAGKANARHDAAIERFLGDLLRIPALGVLAV